MEVPYSVWKCLKQSMQGREHADSIVVFSYCKHQYKPIRFDSSPNPSCPKSNREMAEKREECQSQTEETGTQSLMEKSFHHSGQL